MAQEPEYVSALPARSTRGRRMHTLLEDEDSADEEFWNQDAFAEESGDEEYESEVEEEDVVDDDFHDSESEESEGEVYVAKERTKRTLKAPGRAKPKTPAAAPARAATGDVDAEAGPSTAAPSAPRAVAPTITPGDYEPRKSKRSTAQAILERSEKMRKERDAKPAPERARVEYKELTQEELLEEAKITEYWNLLDLERLLTLEAEMKKKAPTGKKKYDGPSLVYRSSAKEDAGAPVVALARGAEVPELLRQPKPTPAKPNVCVITGLPAKYKDPLTGMPYATIEAFKEVRARYPPLPKPTRATEPEPTPEEPAEVPMVVDQPPIVEEKPVIKKKPAPKKRRGKPSASKLSDVPPKTLKEEVPADEFVNAEAQAFS